MIQGWFRVLRNQELSPLNYRLIFESPFIAKHARPGQFVAVGAAGCLLKRPFSVGDVSGSRVILLYKVVGKATAAMAALRRGDAIDVIGPLGIPFSDVASWYQKIYVAGGVGVPPLYFLARNQSKGNKQDRVFVGARTKSDLLYVPQFKKLGLSVSIATEDGTAGQKGYVTLSFQKLLKKISPALRKHVVVFSCGPKLMMKAVAKICEDANVPCMASLEEVMGCGIGVCMGCVVKVKHDDGFLYQRVCREGPVMETDKILWE